MAGGENIVISKRLVAINSASSIAAKIINMTVILWMYQHLLNRITAEEFAVLPVVMALMVFAPLFFSFFTGGISRYVVEAYARGDREGVARIVSSIFPPLAVMTAAFLAAGMVFAANIDRILTIAPEMAGDARIMMALLIGSFSLQMLGLPFATGFHVRQRFVELNLIGVARDLLRVTLLLVFILGIGPHVIWVVVATAISETSHTVATVIRSRMMVPELRMRPHLFDRTRARTLLGFGFWTTLGRLGDVMYTNAATILLNLFGTAVDVTSYHIGATFYRQITGTVSLATQPLQPVLTALHANGDVRRLGRVVFRGGRYGAWASLAVAVPLVIYADEFIGLYLGGNYSRAAAVIVLFMLIYPFNSPTALLAITSMATAKVRAFFLPAFLFQLAGLILMIIVVRFTDLGAVGMALSLATITVASQLFYYWRLCLRMTERPFGDFLRQVLIPGYTPGLAGAAAWGALDLLAPQSTWMELIGCSLAGGAVYLFVLFAFCLNENERADLGKVMQKIREG